MGDFQWDLAVIGLGYVGLPLAKAAADAGLTVYGYDTDPAKIAAINAGRSPVDDISDQALAATDGLTASCDREPLAHARCIAICVPTPLGHGQRPDLAAVHHAAATIAAKLTPGQIIVLESTVYPGCTSDDLRISLEHSGLTAGKDFHLAYSPERVDPGNTTWTTANTPKLLGGHTPACRDAAAAVYRRFIHTIVECAGTREAETAKLLENTQRLVNIALVNELSRVCHMLGIDTWDVVTAAATKPFGYHSYRPGVGVGGHCIPIDPMYLAWTAKEHTGRPFALIELAQAVNDTQPGYVTGRILNVLRDHGIEPAHARILLAGVTYKPDVRDQRASPTDDIVRRLRATGAHITYLDGHVDNYTVDGQPVEAHSGENQPGPGPTARYHLTAVLQRHSNIPAAQLHTLAPITFDTTGTLTHAPTGHTLHRL